MSFSLNEILVPEASVVVPGRPERDALLSAVVHRLGLADPAQALEQILDRERSLSTAFGLGVAVPHCFLPGLGRTHLGVACVSEGVDFRAPDGQITHAVFVLVEDLEARRGHTVILAHIAALCLNTDLPARLRAVRRPEEIPEHFAACESE
jgi:mannitol/fructose-specific phosphotransferase system IIA component (Ntr-type)